MDQSLTSEERTNVYISRRTNPRRDQNAPTRGLAQVAYTTKIDGINLMELILALNDYASWHYTFAITALFLWYKLNPVKRLLEHYLGTCYRVSYTDTYGEKHTIRIISKDPREAALVQLIINKVQEPCTAKNAETS